MKDYYKILGVKPNASPEDIHARWIELMRRFHPDTRTGEHVEEDRVQEINEAYGVLKDASSRAHYDLKQAYHRENRRLYLRRMSIPPALLIALGIIVLIFVQRPRITPPPSPRASQTIEGQPPSSALYRAPEFFSETEQPGEMDKPDERDGRNSALRPVSRTVGSNVSQNIVPQEIFQKGEMTPVISESKANSPHRSNKSQARVTPSPSSAPTEVTEPRVSKSTGRRTKTSDLKVTAASPSVAEPEKSNSLPQPIPSTPQPEVLEKTTTDAKATHVSAPGASGTSDAPHHITVSLEPHDMSEASEPDQRSPGFIAQRRQSSLIATEEEVKKFFADYRELYSRKDKRGFFSLFSPNAVQNGRDGLDEMKKIYFEFFDQSNELGYQMRDTRIEIYQNAVEVRAFYQIDQTMKKGRKKNVWRGDIRWVLVREDGKLKIRHLDYKPQKSP